MVNIIIQCRNCNKQFNTGDDKIKSKYNFYICPNCGANISLVTTYTTGKMNSELNNGSV